MNERIQELMIEAGKTIPGDKHIDADFCKKFAELIGQECLNLADSIRDGCDQDGENQQALGAAWVGIAIARHFGVE
jgi:hypothetical protein